jgi:ABC-type dipeptide/oligopeptide/nickel transport system permease subunit
MLREDSVKHLLADVRNHATDGRAFLTRAAALGMSASAAAAVLGAAALETGGTGGRFYMYQAPWITIFPGITIAILVLGANMLGDGLRDVLDPRLKR